MNRGSFSKRHRQIQDKVDKFVTSNQMQPAPKARLWLLHRRIYFSFVVVIIYTFLLLHLCILADQLPDLQQRKISPSQRRGLRRHLLDL